MKVRLGNGTNFKIFPRQYESVDINVSLEIEKEFPDETPIAEAVASLSADIKNSILKEIDEKTNYYLVAEEKKKIEISKALGKKPQ